MTIFNKLEFKEDFEKLVQRYKTLFIVSSNMATGVNVLFKTATI